MPKEKCLKYQPPILFLKDYYYYSQKDWAFMISSQSSMYFLGTSCDKPWVSKSNTAWNIIELSLKENVGSSGIWMQPQHSGICRHLEWFFLTHVWGNMWKKQQIKTLLVGKTCGNTFTIKQGGGRMMLRRGVSSANSKQSLKDYYPKHNEMV